MFVDIIGAPPKSSGIMKKHWNLARFQSSGRQGKISGVHVILLMVITLTPYVVLPLFATRFADYAGGIRVFFIQPRLF